MVDGRFGYGNLSGTGTASADYTAAGYDAANVVALDRGTTWLSSGTADQRLIVNCGAAITPTFLGLAGGNWSGWGTVTLQYSSTGLAGSWTTQQTLAGLGSRTDSVEDYYEKVTSAPARQYWCLHWSASSSAPEVALFYLGTLATLIENYGFPGDERDVYNVDVQQSEGKVIMAEQVARRLAAWVLGWSPTLSTVRDQVRTIIQSEGGPKRPFWFVPVDESTSNDYGRAYLVRYQNPSFAMKRPLSTTEIYDFVVPLLEEV